MLTRFKHLLEMIRFSHTLFALPFALLAALMAFELRVHRTANLAVQIQQAAASHQRVFAGLSGSTTPAPNGSITTATPDVWQVRWRQARKLGAAWLGLILCMVFGRSAAMAFNRIADRTLDAENPRTSARHLPAGTLSLKSVMFFWLGCSIAFVASTLLFLPNRWPLIWSLPVLAFICGYSIAKRITLLAHFWLGTALMLVPICAWIAVRGEIAMTTPSDLAPAIVLGGAVLLWVAGFDIIYACQDMEFDKQTGLHSVPAKLGVKNALRLAAVCHLGMIVLLAALPWFYPLFGWVYWTGIAAVAVLLVYEHSLVRPEDLTRVNVAFFHVNAVVSMGLLVIGALDLLT